MISVTTWMFTICFVYGHIVCCLMVIAKMIKISLAYSISKVGNKVFNFKVTW